jgi:glycerol-3-phosphate dehydrogenase
VDLVQGAHIILGGETRRGIYYVEAPGDRRAVFVMPWKGHTLVGTTETPYHGDPGAAQAQPGEISYLMETFRHYFPGRDAPLLDSFAGLRVLPHGASPVFHRSRETLLHPDDPQHPRLITIYGGKLTGYRATAAKVMRLLKKSLPARVALADTAQVVLTS